MKRCFLFFSSGLARPELWGIEKEGRPRGWGCCCCCCLVDKACRTLCDPMDWRTPGFPVLLCLHELAQTHVHWVGDEWKPSHSTISTSLARFSSRGWAGNCYLAIGVKGLYSPCWEPSSPSGLAGRGRLQLPGAAKWSRQGLEGADKGSPSRELMVLPAPLPRNLSVREAILVNVPQVIEQNVYSAASRWNIPQISIILHMLTDGVFEPLYMLANFLSSCSINYWEGYWSF